jgi:NhaA family Na+:H+ antiporter
MEQLAVRFKNAHTPGGNILENEEQQSILQSMEDNVHRMESPLQRMEHGLHLAVSFVVIPIFALANAGIPLDFNEIPALLGQPVSLGIIAGLVFGKALGVFSAAWLVVRLGWCGLSDKVGFTMLGGVSLLAGIGFTMAIFIAGLAFADQQDHLVSAKIGIFLASLAAGFVGYLVLRFSSAER